MATDAISVMKVGVKVMAAVPDRAIVHHAADGVAVLVNLSK